MNRRTAAAALRLPAVLLLGALLLGACAGSSDDLAALPGGAAAGACLEGTVDCQDTSFEPGRIDPEIHVVNSLSAATRQVETAPGSVPDAQALFIQEAVVEGDRITLVVSGTEAPCFVIDRAAVEEDSDTVVAWVYAGEPAGPEAGSADCETMATSTQAVTVTLTEPLGARRLLDGSRAGTVDAS